jgi:hypothetical protein
MRWYWMKLGSFLDMVVKIILKSNSEITGMHADG